MTDKELRKLRREDMLEIMIEQQRQLETLQKQLADAQTRLSDRDIRLEKAGSIAEAAMEMYDIFSRSQQAADDYLKAVQKRAEEQKGCLPMPVARQIRLSIRPRWKPCVSRPDAEFHVAG